MMTLYPLLSPRRQGQIRGALGSWRARPLATRYQIVCKHGHDLTDETNLYRTKMGRKTCRPCALRRGRAYYNGVPEKDWVK